MIPTENLIEATMFAVQDGIRNKLAVVYCSEHHRNPTVEFMTDPANELKYRVHACCGPALRAAEATLEK